MNYTWWVFMSPKYFLKILLKRLILSSCKILKKNDGLERRESECIFRFSSRITRWTQHLQWSLLRSSRCGSDENNPNQKNALYLITDNKNIAWMSYDQRNAGKPNQKLSHSLDFFFLCLIRNKLSLSSSSKYLSFFLCLPRLPSLGSFSSLGLWWCDCWKSLWGSWVLQVPGEEWIFGPLGKSSSTSWHLSAFLYFSRSLLFLLIDSFWVSFFSWGHLLFLREARLFLILWWDLWFAASTWGLLNCLGKSPLFWSSFTFRFILCSLSRISYLSS